MNIKIRRTGVKLMKVRRPGLRLGCGWEACPTVCGQAGNKKSP